MKDMRYYFIKYAVINVMKYVIVYFVVEYYDAYILYPRGYK